MLRDHVAQGARHVSLQRAIIRRLTELGADTELAEDVLEEFETLLAEHQRHLAHAIEEPD